MGSQMELNATTQRNLGQVYGDGENNNELRDAKLNRDLNLALLPLSATGPGGAAKFTQRLQKLKALKFGK